MNVVFSEQQIQQRIGELAQQISRDYGDEVVYAIGILDGSFMFLSDLLRKVNSPVVCQFLKMEMADTEDAGRQPVRSIVFGSPGSVAGKNVLVIDALVDSGITLDHLVQQLRLQGPKSLRTVALIDRQDRRRVDLPLDYAGFPWQAGGQSHLVGYGLAQDGMYRNLPYVASIDSKAAAAGPKGGARA